MTKQLKAPLIGITTYGRNEASAYTLPSSYTDAVRAAGGVPILLPPGEPDAAALLERVDAVVFSGGGDIDPAAYSGSQHPTIYCVDAERDRFELALAQQALKADIPILGICRGLQVLVVACGGNLVTHVPDEYGTALKHRLDLSPTQRYPIHHAVQIVPGSRLAGIVGNTEVDVVSWHHQAARSLPPGWRVVAQAAEDGVIEAIEHQNCFWAIAVQWHPELSARDVAHERLFRGLVDAARAYSSRRWLPERYQSLEVI